MSGWLDGVATGDDLIVVGPVLDAPLDVARLGSLGLSEAPQVAVDGGIQYAVNPILWAGDGDSGVMPKHIPAYFKESQDLTDMRFCLGGLRSGRWRRLHLFGFLGARRDHELANFGEIHAEMKHRDHFEAACLYDGDYRPALTFLQKGPRRFTHQGRFSLLAFDEAQITLKGACQYPAEGVLLPPLSGHGISNIANGEVELHASQPLLLITG